MNSTRNPKVGEIYRSVDRYVQESFEKLFAALAAQGRIAPDVDIPTLTKLFFVIGDGMFMRRALDPNFDSKALLPAVMALIGKLLNVTPETLHRRQSRGETSMKRFFLTLLVLAAIGGAGIFLAPHSGAAAHALPGQRQPCRAHAGRPEG